MKKLLSSLFGACALTVSLAACATGGSSDTPADDGSIQVVASTSIWGSVAQEVTAAGKDKAGDKNSDDAARAVTVSSILTSKSDDPHEYEATAVDLARINAADLVVGNGAGYDNWLTDHVPANTPVVTAADISEHDHAHGHDHEHGHKHDHEQSVNPHVWFDMKAVSSFASAVADKIHQIDASAPADATPVIEKTTSYTKRIKALKGANVVVTEPVIGYLIQDSKLKNVTPAGFARAIANEAEPSAADIAATRQLIANGKADILITNTQAQTPAAKQLIAAATKRGIAIININETPDEGQSYFDYVEAVLSALEAAVK